MTEQNELFTVSQDISTSLALQSKMKEVKCYLSKLKTNIYSYIVYKRYKEDTFVGWRIKYTISQIDKYNTLTHDAILREIAIIFDTSAEFKQKIVGYHQPDICIMLQLFDPIVKRLALEQCNKWTRLEFDDAYIMCQACMFELYQKGYYLHKDLLRKSFNNKVLISLRPYKNEPSIVSMEDLIMQDEDMSFGDTLEDKEAIYKQEDEEEHEELMRVFDKVKAFCVDIMGERQFEQLFNEYANKRTTSWSRKKLQTLKRMLLIRGITLKNFK